MFGIYVTHPQVRIDPDVPVPCWGLSEPGGGNLFAFALADRSLACDWKPFELWQGWQK